MTEGLNFIYRIYYFYRINSPNRNTKNILVAPLNWGLGHATRCIPIINELLAEGFNPIIASDGNALNLLQREFPELKSIELPTYNIQYPTNGAFLNWKLFVGLPTILNSIKLEKSIVEKLVESENLIGIISDNRLGIISSKVPSVYITHQVKVFSGLYTFFTSKIHQYYINRFNECWILDDDSRIKLAGNLSNSNGIENFKYIGVLSRLKISKVDLKYDLLVLLSGLEPLRTQLEEKLLFELKSYTGKVLFVRGELTEKKKTIQESRITITDFLLSEELEIAINQSKVVLARSGYSTIMDLAKLNKKAFFIPTKGQNEQEYLAKYLEKQRIAPFSSVKEFKIELLEQVKNYSGFGENYNSKLPQDLFDLFHGK